MRGGGGGVVWRDDAGINCILPKPGILTVCTLGTYVNNREKMSYKIKLNNSIAFFKTSNLQK